MIHDRVRVPLETIDFRGEPTAAWPALMRRLVRSRIDPGKAPLVRRTLARLGERRWALVQIEHHLIHDGWSATVLADELSELYSARVERRLHRLPALEVQFQDFARWERAVVESETVRRELEQWKLVLDPDPPLLELPTDRPRPPRESFDGGSIRRRLEPALAARLRSTALEGNATLFMVTLAAFLVQLRAYSGRDYLPGGVRDRQPTREGVGADDRDGPQHGRPCAANSTGTRRSGSSCNGFRRVALTTPTRTSMRRSMPWSKGLQPPRDPSRSPLIQALSSFHDAPRWRSAGAGLDVGLVQVIPNCTSKADLNVIGINDRDGGVTFVWDTPTCSPTPPPTASPATTCTSSSSSSSAPTPPFPSSPFVIMPNSHRSSAGERAPRNTTATPRSTV